MPNQFVRIQVVNEMALTDALFEFVTDPSAASRNARPVIQELHDIAPHMVDIAESMVIDGVDERHYVADYIHAIATGEGLYEG
jgi:hypothetical protein